MLRRLIVDLIGGLLDTVARPITLPNDRERRIAKLRAQGRAILEEKRGES